MRDSVLFSDGETAITPAHVMAAAAYWGALDPVDVAACHGLACVQQAVAEGIEVPGADLQAASERFRRAHGLRSAQATASWMAARGVSIEEFTDYLERHALAERTGAPTNSIDDVKDVSPEVLWAEAVFSGVGDRWTQRLATRMAVAREEAGSAGVPPSLFDTPEVEGCSPDALHAWLERLAVSASWAERVVILEATYARFASAVQTPAKMDGALRLQWDALVAFELEMGAFDTEAAAREACLCVTEDGATVSAVSAMARGHFQEGRVWLSELPEEIRAHALSAAEGALLPVFLWNEQQIVCRVLRKSEPSLTDGPTRKKVEDVVVEEASQSLLRRHISWPARGME